LSPGFTGLPHWGQNLGVRATGAGAVGVGVTVGTCWGGGVWGMLKGVVVGGVGAMAPPAALILLESSL